MTAHSRQDSRTARTPAEDDEETARVEAARTGNAEAIAWLYERYCNRIYSYVYGRLGDHSVAEDVTGQLFLKVVEKIESFNWQGGGFAAWLFRIAHNLVVDTYRQRARHNHLSIDETSVVLPPRSALASGDPEAHVERSEVLSLLRSCISQLTESQAQVILLKYAAELSNPEIAEVMSRTSNAVNSLHYDAIKKLERLLNKKGYEWSR